jgi:hypothetical protein
VQSVYGRDAEGLISVDDGVEFVVAG